MRELLYKIEWPSVRRLRIGILCTYWHFVRALPYSVIELTQSLWDSGSWIDSVHHNCAHPKIKCSKSSLYRVIYCGVPGDINLKLFPQIFREISSRNVFAYVVTVNYFDVFPHNINFLLKRG